MSNLFAQMFVYRAAARPKHNLSAQAVPGIACYAFKHGS